MKVAVLNHWDIGGGAARAAWRLFKALQAQSIQASYFVRVKESNDPDVEELPTASHHWDHIDGLVQSNYIDNNRSDLSNTYFSSTFNQLDFNQVEGIVSADIINLHWVEKMISLDGLQKLVQLKKPIVWTLHDQRPMTGGCHYTAGCNGFVDNGCHQCRQLRFDRYHLPWKTLQAKKQILKDVNLTIVTPSKWLAQEAKRSEVFSEHPIEVIPNSIETDIFRPKNKTLAKEALGIPPHQICIMFGAQNSSERRKGFDILQTAVNQALRNPGFQKLHESGKLSIITIGHTHESEWTVPIQRHDFGSISEDDRLALIYAAADLFVLPSLEDNLPNTMLEAMACGTPVLGFNIGGIPDLVHNWETGFVVNQVHPISLSIALTRLILQPEKLATMSTACSNLVSRTFNQKVQAHKYSILFEKLLQREQSSPGLAVESDLSAFDDVIGQSLRIQ